MKKVSVIVPFYNVEKYIDKCLNSLINQTLEDIEIIIVNDGSKDTSETIAKEYASKYKNKIVYLEKENGGLSDARNYAIPYATGEYIAFLDSDDYVEFDMYEQMYKKAKKENADIVECNLLWEYPNETIESKGRIYKDKHDILLNARVVAWNKLIKRELIEKTKVKFPYGLRYEDVEFFYKLIPYINKLEIVNKSFVHYVQRDNSISNSQNARTKEIIDILDNVIAYYKENSIYEEYKNELEYNYARYLLCSSFLRMIMIEDKNERKEIIKYSWNKLNETFPNWKKNSYIRNKNLKNNYMLSVNNITIKIYEKIGRFSFVRKMLQRKFA